MVVAIALIDTAGRVLVQQRPEGKTMAGLWEFPGGKIETGETPERALIREIREELGIEIGVVEPLSFASAPLDAGHLVMLVYACRAWHGIPQALHASTLQWIDPGELRALPMPPADLPLIPSIVAAAQRLSE